MTDNSGKAVDQDAEQLRALGYVSHFDRTMSKWENFSLGFTYLSPVVGVYTLFADLFRRGRPADVVDLYPRRLGPADGVPGVRRDRLAVPDFRRPVPLGAAPGGQALGLDGRMGLRLGAVLHDGGRGHRHRAVSRPVVRASTARPSRPPSSRSCSSP